MWRRRFIGFWLLVATTATIVVSTIGFAYAAVVDTFKPEVVIAEVTETMETSEIVLMYNESETNMENSLICEETEYVEAISEPETQATIFETEAVTIPTETFAEEQVTETQPKSYANLLSEAQSSATQSVDEDDPLAITFVEEQENGTRIYNFKKDTITIPANLLQRDPMVSESGYVEKITHVPHYIQQSYPHNDYGRHGTISSHGCGIASCAMVYSYLLDREIRPDELAEKYGRYNTEHGSDYALFSKSAEDYGLEVTMSHKWSEVEEALRNGCVVIALVKSNTIFTSGGHYIVYYGINEDNKILINDPNIYNFGRWSSNALKTGFQEGFDMKYVKYSVPCWIYQPKDIEAIAERTENNQT